MGFFEKLKRAFAKIKGKLIVAAILVLAITIFAVAPLSVAIKNGRVAGMNKTETELGTIEQVKFDWEVFFVDIATYLMAPHKAISMCFSTDYFDMFWSIERFFIMVYLLFVMVGVARAFPKHEYDDIEHGSSDWSENGEQYRILSKKSGIVLAEKNYLPVDKRGNVNVLVVRRFWSW
jgi:hypothetical protein